MENESIKVQWWLCSQCKYEIAASDVVTCPNCGVGMTAVASAGEIEDTRNHDA